MEPYAKNEEWVFYTNPLSKLEPSDVRGKYLFFGSDKEKLFNLGVKIMEIFGLPMMKIPKSDIPNNSPGFEFVVAVFDVSNRYAKEIETWLLTENEYNDINYRFYKKEKDSENGRYSEQFKRSSAFQRRKRSIHS